MRILFVCSVVLLHACATTPRPFEVSRSCAPPYTMSVQGGVQGNERYIQKNLHEVCSQGPIGTERVSTEVQTPYSNENLSETVTNNGAGTTRVESYQTQNPGLIEGGRNITTPNANYGFSWGIRFIPGY